MNDNTISNFQPKTGIIVYENEYKQAYVEQHDIIDNQFQSGRPLTKDDLKFFGKMAMDEKSVVNKKVFPYRLILGYNTDVVDDVVTWICPEQKIHLMFAKSVKGIKSGMYYIPNLVFQSNGKNVKVYSIKKRDIHKLNPDTILYQAPFMNVYSSGEVCIGSAKIKQFADVNELIYNVEHMFFNSVFTHTNTNMIVKGSLLDAYNNQKNKFSEKLLIKSCTLKSLC
jgi:PRTRC genetic system protein B